MNTLEKKTEENFRLIRRDLTLNSTRIVNFVVEHNPSIKKTELMFVEAKQKVKKLIAITIFMTVGFCANAQLNILPNGNVGIGVTSPYAKFQVNTGSTSITLIPSNGPNIGGYDGTTGDTRIDFWHPISKYNKLRFKGYVLSSDSTLKTDISPLENATDILKQVKTYSYYFNSDCQESRQKDYGILAQELAGILPELIDTAKETMLVNYNAFFAFLIKGFNEQQTVIETQQAEVNQLQMNTDLQQTEIHQLQGAVDQQQQEINQHQTIINQLQITSAQQQGTINQQQQEINQHQAIINQLQIASAQQQGTINQQQIEFNQIQQEMQILQQIAFEQEMDLMQLQNMVNELREAISLCCKGTDMGRQQDTSNNNSSLIQQKAILYQNTPNPFSTDTEISCNIPVINNNAFIYIYSLQGVELMSFPIVQAGFSTITVYASALSAGMYLYALVIDGVIADTKRMILTK